MAGPLTGVRVLDLADACGATCGKMLAELGAETTLLEAPQGSPMRRIGPFFATPPATNNSAFFWHYNAGKRSVCIDLDEAQGRARLVELAASSDVLVETLPPGRLAELGLSYEQVAAGNPGLILVSITPFGQHGPYRHYRGSDLVCQAMGGMLAVNGAADGTPLQGVGLPAYHCAGTLAAFGALIALHERDRSGLGQWVDVSIQAAVVTCVEHVSSRFLTDGRVDRRRGGTHWSGDFRIGPAADGYVVHSTLGDWTTLLEWLKGDGQAQDLIHPAWADVEHRRRNCEHFFDVLDQWSRLYSADELSTAAQLRRLPIAAVRSPAALRSDAHLVQRQHFVTPQPEGRSRAIRYPRSAFRFSRSAWAPPSPADRLGASAAATDGATATRRPVDIDRRSHGLIGSQIAAPLQGVRVVDFTWVVAGPFATRLLADFGAEVVKIERLDTPRERTAVGRNLNRGKRSLAIDLSADEGLALVRRLIQTADVVVDNFSARVMANLGLDHEALRRLRADLITVNLSGFGLSGPYRDYVSYGPTLQALAGHTWSMRAQADGAPFGWGFSYSDMIAGCSAALAIVAALCHRQRSGDGQHLDLSQFEILIASLGPGLLAALNAAEADQTAPFVDNNSQEMPSVPHGVFRCADLVISRQRRDRWCAVAVFGDTDWQLCRAAMGDPEWCRDERFATQAGRHAHRVELHTLVESWTRTLPAEAVMQVLQEAGVAAGLVAEADDLCQRDPQLRARGYWQGVDGKASAATCAGAPILLSRSPVRGVQPAPEVGEHSDILLKQLLGLSVTEISALRGRGIIA